MVPDSFSLALHGAQSIFQTAEEPRFAAAAGNTGRRSRVRAGKGVAGNVERSRSSPGNRGGPQYHGGRKGAATGGVGNTAQELSARESCTGLRALGGGIEFGLGSRCRKGSGKSARTESLDRPPQRRDNARAEHVMDRAYIEVVRLLLESAPSIFETTPHFAMKGGTAISLFIEDMPRLSVDIDAVYTDHQATRDNALKSISSALETARKRLAIADVKAEVSSTKDGDEIKLFIRRGRNQVKVEVNHVFRGTVLPVARPSAPRLHPDRARFATRERLESTRTHSRAARSTDS